MQLLKKNPITPSLRQKVILKYKNLLKIKLRNLKKRIVKKGGRNNQGRITVRHRGGGHKKIYRFIDFKRKESISKILFFSYDPNRTALLAHCQNENGIKYNLLAPENVKIGDILYSGINLKNHSVGDSDLLKYIPLGKVIHNIELKPNKGAQLVRSAGNFAHIIEKSEKYARVQFKSGEQRLLHLNCRATVGIVSNQLHNQRILGSAGASRWLGIRPTVRGVAMNPVDHPHGGGQGKTSGGRPSVSPKGKITKGMPTRKKKQNFQIVLNVRTFKYSKKQSKRKGKYSL